MSSTAQAPYEEADPRLVCPEVRTHREAGELELTTAIEQTLETYGIENWGAGYFDINRKGNLDRPPFGVGSAPRGRRAARSLTTSRRRGIQTPVLLRFPQLVAGASAEAPTRLPQLHPRVRVPGRAHVRLPDEGQPATGGRRGVPARGLALRLRARSRVEGRALRARSRWSSRSDSLLVLNGFKDEEFIELAFARRALAASASSSSSRNSTSSITCSRWPSATRAATCRCSACASSSTRRARGAGRSRAARRRSLA